jgi:hypothetical protein
MQLNGGYAARKRRSDFPNTVRGRLACGPRFPLVTNHCRSRRTLSAALHLLPILALAFGLWFVLPVHASTAPRTWKGGVVRYYDGSGMRQSVITAAARWNASGARVKLQRVDLAHDADVVLKVDDRELHGLCGSDCLGYTTSIGRPADGPTTVLLASELRGNPRPLSVWVAAHELGHVLGLQHQKGHRCSLMSPHAFDTRCAPSLAATPPTLAQLACVPAPADVAAAVRLYGGEPAADDPRCR